MTVAQSQPPTLPTNHPVRDAARPSTRSDVDFALHRAAKYLRAGGDRELIEPFVDEWLDYQAELDLREEIAAL